MGRDRALLPFVRVLRDTLLRRRRPVTIDFRATKKMYVEGTLLFHAEVHRALLLLKDKTAVAIIPPTNKKVLEVLKQIGFLGLIGSEVAVTPTADDVVHWCSAHGRRADGVSAGDLLTRTTGTMAEPVKRGLYAGLTEAMTNASEHAYLEPRSDGFGRSSDVDWWVFSQVRDERLTVVICDLGIGISRSLPHTAGAEPSLLKRLARILDPTRPHRDEGAIKFALEIGRTRTEMKHRGFGLFRNIRGVIDRHSAGSMFIASNRGCYAFALGGPPFGTGENTSRLSRSINGTIVGWSLPLSGQAEAGDANSH